MHYSQQPSSVSIEQHPAVSSGVGSSRIVHARLQGFITGPLLDEAFGELERGLDACERALTAEAEAERVPAVERPVEGGDGAPSKPPPQLVGSGPAGLLCDVSEVAGYAAETARLARRWLGRAEKRGVRRIALVAHSSVLRTTVELLRGRTPVDVRCFPSESSARAWLTHP